MSHVAERWVFPNVLVARGDHEPPSGRQRQIRDDWRPGLHSMPDVERVEEVGLLGLRVLACPDVPPVCPALRRMTKPVKGKQAGVDRLEGDSELGTRLGMQRGEAETLTRNTLSSASSAVTQSPYPAAALPQAFRLRHYADGDCRARGSQLGARRPFKRKRARRSASPSSRDTAASASADSASSCQTLKRTCRSPSSGAR
jgi:hypothetical protein